MKRPNLSKVEEIVLDQRTGSVRLVSAGRTFLSVPAEVLETERIAVGSVVEADQLQRLEAAADRNAAYRTAIRMLERRPFGKVDLGRRLSLKGHSSEAVSAAVERAEASGYLNDTRFAENFVQSRTARGRGPARLRRELLLMGIPRPVVDGALGADVTDPEAVAERVKSLISKRLPQLRGSPAPEARRRLLAYLARRGYSGLEVSRQVRAALQEAAGSGITGVVDPGLDD